MARYMPEYQKSLYRDINVLYVEDELFSREKLLRVLSRRFANVHVAIDGKEGYQLYEKYKPDLIIADIKTSQMSGLEMIKRIRGTNDQVQIIVTTADNENESFIQSIENSVNYFILKPIDLERFLLAIQKSIYQVQLEKELDKQKHLTRAILDFQDNLIFVVENGEIVEFNQAFSNFTGIEKSQIYPNAKLLSNIFLEDPLYYTPLEKGKWVQELAALGKKSVKMKWKSKSGKNVIFYIKTSHISTPNQILFVCTDITELEAESRKNVLLTMIDPLTNCFNRVKFDELLDSEIRRTERYNHPFSLILIDIDSFKDINNEFNPIGGNEVLVTLSTIIQQRIRESDIFARWGGDEFIILTPDTNLNGAKELAESIRGIIDEFVFKKAGHLTCSFGISEFINGKTKRELILEAEQALLRSKNKGRNCVTAAGVYDA
jgi:two-component system cell cycle response regulator